MATKKTPTPNKSFACSQCDFKTTTQGGLNRHVNTKHRVDNAVNVDEQKPKAKPAAKAKKKAQPKRRTHRKLDPVKAYDYYFSDATRSYADVAKEFGVSKQAVEAIAKVDVEEVVNGKKSKSWVTWAEHRLDLVEEAQKKRDEEYRKSIPVRNEEHLKQYRNLQIATSNKITMLAMQGEWLVNPKTGAKVKVQELSARELADAAKALKLAIDGERVILGLATSVATIKPGSDDETGKGWGELLALAMKQASDEPTNI